MLNQHDQVKVQFGEYSTQPWYAKNVPCIILAVRRADPKSNVFCDEYLVQKTFEGECLGVATEASKKNKGLVFGDLVSPKIFYYGSKSQADGVILTRVDLARKLGFKI
jgi:hypothetical protein